MTIDCKFVQEHLSAWMDGELEAKSQAEVQQHLGTCDRCSLDLAHFEKLGQMARSCTVGTCSPPSWDLIEQKICSRDDDQNLIGRDPTMQSRIYGTRLFPGSRQWRAIASVFVTFAAIVLVIVSFGRLWPLHNLSKDHATTHNASNVSLNLQPVVELFQDDPQASINALKGQFTLEDFTLAEADANFGRSTYVSTFWNDRALPGSAKPSSTVLLSLPSCPCPKGQCTCGENGCNCIASICQRPDGSIYIVFEQCQAQKVGFGTLPVENVKRNGYEFQEIRFGGTRAISFDWSSGKVIVVGLRNDSEVESLFANDL